MVAIVPVKFYQCIPCGSIKKKKKKAKFLMFFCQNFHLLKHTGWLEITSSNFPVVGFEGMFKSMILMLETMKSIGLEQLFI